MTRIGSISLSTFIGLLGASIALAGPPVVTQVEPRQGYVDQSTPIRIIGASFEPQARVALLPVTPVRVPTPNDARAVAAAGNIAYVVDGDLRIFDLAAGPVPKLLASADMPRGNTPYRPPSAQGIAISGTTAFVGGTYYRRAGGWPHFYRWESYVEILDVSDPAAPRYLGYFGVLGQPGAGALAVADGLAYMVGGCLGLVVIDVRDPASPQMVGSLAEGCFEDVAVANGFAFLAGGQAGIAVVDVRNPADPVHVADFDTPGYSAGVTLSGSRLLVADGEAGLQLVDVADPAAPALIAGFETPGWASDVAVTGSTAFVTDGPTGGLRTVDITDPSDPLPVSHCSMPGDARAVAVAGARALVASGSGGLQISDGACAECGVMGSLRTLPAPKHVAVSGSVALVAGPLGDEGRTGLRVVDIGRPAKPELVGSVETQGAAEGVATVEGLAFVTSRTQEAPAHLSIIALADPTVPIVVGAIELPDDGLDVAVQEQIAFVAAGPAGLQLVDVSDPAAPTVISGLHTHPVAQGVAVSGRYAYVAAGIGGLQLVDVDDPAAPFVAGWIELPGPALRVAVRDRYAFVAAGDTGLQVVDCGDPTAPTRIGGFDTPGRALDVAALGNLVFIADDAAGVLVLDVSQPAEPSPVTHHATIGTASGLALACDLAVVISEVTGLELFRPNAGVQDTTWTADDELTAIVPPACTPGPYHLRATNGEPEAGYLPRAFQSCMRRQLDVALVPWLDAPDGAATTPVDRDALRWQLAIGGDDIFVCPQPAYRASLLLPALPAQLELRHEPATEPGTIGIELLVAAEGESGVVRLLADDPDQADRLWERISAAGRITVPRAETRRSAALDLHLTRRAHPGEALPDPLGPSSLKGPRSRGRRASAPVVPDTATTFQYRFARERLIGASAAGPGVDLAFEVIARDLVGCETRAGARFAEALVAHPGWSIGDDLDGDGFADRADNCPLDGNPSQADADGDGLGDACDVCVDVGDAGQQDGDHDGVGDACDNCRAAVNGCQIDADRDGWGDTCDNCPIAWNPDQADSDGDGGGDACDAESP